MSENKNSKWYKEIGGDWGCVKLGKSWVWYDCLWCARYQWPEKFSTPRWQGPPSDAIIKAKNNRTQRRFLCQGAKRHEEIVLAKHNISASSK